MAFQKVKHCISQQTGIHIPYRMPLRTPRLWAADGGLLRDQLTQYISSLPIPVHLKSYYGTAISAIRVKGRSISNMLCTPNLTCTIEELVPFVNRPFESEIHGTVNFTQFCCVLLVTWCYRVLLSCHFRPK